MNRIIAEKNTETCIIRKYSSMLKLAKVLLYMPTLFLIMLEKSTANRGSLQPFLDFPGTSSGIFRGLWELLKTIKVTASVGRAVTGGCYCWGAPAADGTAETIMGMTYRAWSPEPLGAAAPSTTLATQHARDDGSAELLREDAGLQV